jgi:hypothetical protein
MSEGRMRGQGDGQAFLCVDAHSEAVLVVCSDYLE